MSKKKGFTLIEILLVFALIAILGTAAVSNFLSSTRTFNFLGKYEEVVAAIRNVRTFAVANKQMEAGMIRYGIEINKKKITVFSDANTYYEKDEKDTVFLNESIDFTNTDYEIEVKNLASLPVYVFYENGTGDVEIFHKGVELTKDTTKCIYLRFYNASNERFIDINNISGLTETFDETKCK